MGTNFYLANMPENCDSMDVEYHIGKRSAAGLYCWDCGITLCKGGEFWVHQSEPEQLLNHFWAPFYKSCGEWFDKCPICGKAPKNEGFNGAGARELGFNQKKPKKKAGVRSCASFGWAMPPSEAMKKIKKIGVVDEYGQKYTYEEFQEVLSECPIQFFNNIGQQFS